MKYKLLIVFIFFSPALFSQNAKPAQLLKKFASVCNAYKQLPLQLAIEYKKTSNIPFRGEESTSMEGVFYIQKDAAYIRFGDAEQIITDSLALVVMKSISQMQLSETNAGIAAQINNMANMPVVDSSVNSFIQKYSIQQLRGDKETDVLEITNRQNLSGTEASFETITLSYNIKDESPKKIVTVKRSLVKKSTGENPGFSAVTVSIPQKGEYLIKEDVTEYVYKSITHDVNKKMPVTLSDRIVKDPFGNYVPVKTYENYKLVLN